MWRDNFESEKQKSKKAKPQKKRKFGESKILKYFKDDSPRAFKTLKRVLNYLKSSVRHETIYRRYFSRYREIFFEIIDLDLVSINFFSINSRFFDNLDLEKSQMPNTTKKVKEKALVDAHGDVAPVAQCFCIWPLNG